MPRALSLLVLATSLAAAAAMTGACTGDNEPAATPSPSATVALTGVHTAELADLYAGNDPEAQDLREGRCFAQALEQRLDEQALIDSGIVGTDGDVVDNLPIFDAATAAAWVDAQLTCVDFVTASTRALLTQRRGDLDAETYGACLRDALSDDEIRVALEETLSGGFDSPEVAALADAQATCAR